MTREEFIAAQKSMAATEAEALEDFQERLRSKELREDVQNLMDQSVPGGLIERQATTLLSVLNQLVPANAIVGENNAGEDDGVIA